VEVLACFPNYGKPWKEYCLVCQFPSVLYPLLTLVIFELISLLSIKFDKQQTSKAMKLL